MSSDYPLLPGEKPPQVRRRIGAAFMLDEQSFLRKTEEVPVQNYTHNTTTQHWLHKPLPTQATNTGHQHHYQHRLHKPLPTEVTNTGQLNTTTNTGYINHYHLPAPPNPLSTEPSIDKTQQDFLMSLLFKPRIRISAQPDPDTDRTQSNPVCVCVHWHMSAQVCM